MIPTAKTSIFYSYQSAYSAVTKLRNLLRRHKQNSAYVFSCDVLCLVPFKQSTEPKIDDLELRLIKADVFVAQHDILWLDVSMDVVQLMDRLESFEHSLYYRSYFVL